MKIIQISSVSHSLLMKDYEKDIINDWYSQVANQIKKRYPKLDVECWTIERKYKKKYEKYHNKIKYRIFPTNFSIRHSLEISLNMIKALKEEIRSNDKVIVHFHEYHMLQVYLTLLLIKSKNIKFIAQHHGGRSPFSNLIKYPRFFILSPIIGVMEFLEKLLFKKIEVFYALSDKEIKYLKRTAPKSKISFQTMGIDESYFEKKDKIIARKKLNLKENKKYGLFLGRIKTTKGIRELLDAVKGEKIELLLIGDGVDTDKYKEYVKENNLDNVHFLGQKFGEEKKLYLSACDFLILPSYTEGAPVVLMEAIAKNLPVIATDVGGISKMIKDGREGIIIPVKSSEAIKQAIRKIKPKKDIRKYANVYKWDNIIKNTIEDYGN